MSTSTRDRIIDEAMHLFSEQGYAATSIAKIEAAAGLSPGAGGLYHHFKSKQDVLAAGIERNLGRLDALRDIQRVLAPLNDLKAELMLTARFVLTELDSESELLRILAAEARSRPELLRSAVDELVNKTFDGFTSWIEARIQPSNDGRNASAIAAVGLGALLSSRLLRDVIGIPAQVDDEALIDAWVALMMNALSADGA
jgi:AcrR family transcriptional regulator